MASSRLSRSNNAFPVKKRKEKLGKKVTKKNKEYRMYHIEIHESKLPLTGTIIINFTDKMCSLL